MYYIDHQIANPICQLFGIVVDQIPGFESYSPKGGWSDIPEARIVQRESAAYSLLFDDAMQTNKKSATRAFASMLGATVTSKAKEPRTIVKPITRSTTRQSTLDSLFSARIQLDAVKEVKRKKAKISDP